MRKISLELARPERFELPTTWFEARYSIQLSYGRSFLKITKTKGYRLFYPIAVDPLFDFYARAHVRLVRTTPQNTRTTAAHRTRSLSRAPPITAANTTLDSLTAATSPIGATLMAQMTIQ